MEHESIFQAGSGKPAGNEWDRIIRYRYQDVAREFGQPAYRNRLGWVGLVVVRSACVNEAGCFFGGSAAAAGNRAHLDARARKQCAQRLRHPAGPCDADCVVLFGHR